MQRHPLGMSIGLVVLVFGLSIAAPGCARKRRPEDYTPAATLAQTALQEVLEAWQNQRPVRKQLGEHLPTIEPVDRYRSPGQILRSYKILGEVSGSAGRTFEVELELDRPSQRRHDRYVVIGIEPLWVYHQSDYEMMCHWEHPMEPGKIKTAP